MKRKLKTHHWLPVAALGLAFSAALALSAPEITVSTFDDDTSVSGVWSWWGGATVAWDGAQDHTGGTSGSLYISHVADAGDSIMVALAFSGNQWDGGTKYDLTTYTNLSFWLKWDTTASTMPISTFNSEGGAGLTMYVNDQANGQYNSWNDANRHALPAQLIPDAASNGWVHVNYPIVSTIPNIDMIMAIAFNDWKPVPWSGDVAFWVDDIVLQPSAVDQIPPPTMSLASPEPGLNLAAISGPYNRECIRTVNSQTWLGQGSTPVSYSFTVTNGVDGTDGTQFQTHIFLAPSPGTETSPDWNEANCIFLDIESTTNGGYGCTFRYKTNQPEGNTMLYNVGPVSGVNITSGGSGYTSAPAVEFTGGGGSGATATAEIDTVAGTVTNVVIDMGGSGYASPPAVAFTGGGGSGATGTATIPATGIGDLGSITNLERQGTWTLTFLNDTNVTISGPGGTSASFNMPLEAAQLFGDPVYAYFGVQANGDNGLAIGKSTVLSEIKITGTANPLDDVFANDSSLDTNIWSVVAVDTAAISVVPSTARYWLQWTVPDGGFSPIQTADLTMPGSQWDDVAGTRVQVGSVKRVLVDSSQLPGANSGYFGMIKRQFTQLQVLLPGETNAPNTLTGKIGTPNPVSLSGDNGLISFTVNACDPAWHIVSSSDTIHITTDDSSAVTPLDMGMVGGTAVFTADNSLQFNSQGSFTITATDVTDSSKTPADSSQVTVGP